MIWTSSCEKPALICEEAVLTHAELHDRVTARTVRLQDLPVRCWRAAIDLPDSFTLLEWVLACWRLGVSVMILDPRLTAAEKQTRLEAYAPDVVIRTTELAGGRAPFQMFHTQVDDRIEAGVSPGSGSVGSIATTGAGGSVDPKDKPALVLFSSGSTGVPKTIVRSFASIEREARQYAVEPGTPSGDSEVLCLVPVSHSFGLLSAALFTLKQGGTVRFLEIPNPLGMVEALHLESVTHVYGVAFHYQILSKGLEKHQGGRIGLPLFLSSGGPLPDELTASLHARYRISIGQQYGMSEVGYISVDAYGAAPGTVGRIADHHEWRVDEEDQLVLALPDSPYSEPQPNWMGRSEGNGGELHTNDLVRFENNGFMRLNGRTNDQVSIGGLKVSLDEIDGVLLQHPDIEDCCTVAHSHPIFGTQLHSFIVWKSATDFSAARIQQWLKLVIADYKVPKSYRLIDRIPASASGKRLKGELLKELEADGQNARN